MDSRESAADAHSPCGRSLGQSKKQEISNAGEEEQRSGAAEKSTAVLAPNSLVFRLKNFDSVYRESYQLRLERKVLKRLGLEMYVNDGWVLEHFHPQVARRISKAAVSVLDCRLMLLELSLPFS